MQIGDQCTTFQHQEPKFRVVLSLGLLTMVVVASAQGDDWPQFRGPNASGLSEGTRPLPVTFSLEEIRRSALYAARARFA